MKKIAILLFTLAAFQYLSHAQIADNSSYDTLYYCGFEDSLDRADWSIRNPLGGYGDWFMDTAVSATGRYSLYYSADGGATNSYTRPSSNPYGSNYNSEYIYRTIFLDPSYTEYRLSFDYRGNGEVFNNHYYDFAKVMVSPSPPNFSNAGSNSDPNSYDPIVCDILFPHLVNVEEWTPFAVELDHSYSGTHCLLFQWYNDASRIYEPPAAIDNICIVGNSCSSIRNLQANVVDSMVMLSWNADPPAASYTLLYKAASDSVYTEVTVSDNYHRLYHLEDSAEYEWAVRANCAGGDGFWKTSSFFIEPMEELTLASVPYHCDFSDSVENARWSFANGNYVNQWYAGAESQSSDSMLYISNNGGLTNAYTVSSAADVWAYRDFFIDDVYQEYNVSFDFKGMGQAGADYVMAFWGELETPDGNVVPEHATALTGNLCAVSDWQHYRFLIEPPHPGAYRLFFYWKNNASGGTNPPAAIDNVVVEGFTCRHPGNPCAAEIFDTNALLVWDPIPSAEFYTVAYRSENESSFHITTASSPSLELTNLQPTTNYIWTVQTNCSPDDGSGWVNEMSFHTYSRMGRVPYSCTFEDSTEIALWTTNSNIETRWTVGTATSHSSNHCLYVSDDDGAHNHYSDAVGSIWAYSDIFFNPIYAEYELSFFFKCGGNAYDYALAYLGPPAVPSWADCPANAVALDGKLNNSYSWTCKSYRLGADHQGLQRLYFFWNSNHYLVSPNNPAAAIDDIAVDGRICHSPQAPTIDSTTTHSITFSFTPYSPDEHEWQAVIAYRNWAMDESTAVTLTEPTYTFEGLYGASQYRIYVRTLCDDNTYSFWSEATVVSTDTATDNIPASLTSSDIVLYPNPARQYVDIVSDHAAEIVGLQVFDLSGRMLEAHTVVDQPCRIDLKHYASGMYIVKVVCRNGIVTKSFIKE